MILANGRAVRAWWLLLPAMMLYAGAFLLPLVLIGAYSLAHFKGGVTTFDLSLENYTGALTGGFVLPVLLRTIRLSAMITAVCLVLGVPFALQMRCAGPRLRLLLTFAVVSPLLTSVIVRNVSWLLILGKNGLVNETLHRVGLISEPLALLYNEVAVVVGVVHVYLTFMVLPVYASLAAIDPRLEESATSLGASRLRVLASVTLPLAMPGIAAGSMLVFILALGIYVTPAMMGGGFVVTIPMVISDLARNQYNWPQASAVSVLLLLIVGCALTMLAALAPRSASGRP